MIRPTFVVVAVLLLLVPGRSDGRASLRAPTRDVDVIAYDYAFAAPSELSAGHTTFRFTNKGQVIHELDVALLKGGTTAREVMSALNAGKLPKSLIEGPVGILIARPGHRSSVGLSTDLLAGRNYLVICRFQDSTSAPMHSKMGMITVVHVTPAAAAAMPKERVDTIAGADYAFRAPLTLAPGSHTLTFVNAGKVTHEVNVALLRPGVTTAQAFKVLQADGELDPLVEEWLGVLFAKAGGSTLGRLQVTLLPDREYVISCGMTDGDKAPVHATLGMFGSMRTTSPARPRR